MIHGCFNFDLVNSEGRKGGNGTSCVLQRAVISSHIALGDIKLEENSFRNVKTVDLPVPGRWGTAYSYYAPEDRCVTHQQSGTKRVYIRFINQNTEKKFR